MGSDQEIFAKIKAEQGVLAEIVEEIERRYGEDLLKFCKRILVTYEEQPLEDIVQEIFEAVYHHIQQYDVNRGPAGIKPWLYGIARNKCVNELRKTDNRAIATPDFTEVGPNNPRAQEKEDHPIQIILAKRAFAELPTTDRLMVTTGLMGWFSRQEMADMFGYDNPNSYDRQISRIKQKMREIVEG